MSIEIGKVYRVKKFEEFPEKFPKCGLEHYTYKHYLCDTIVNVSDVYTFEDPDWGTHCKCASCDPKKDWAYPFYINEQLLEEIPYEKTVKWSGYFAYLMEWMEAHGDAEFYGMSPVSFDEWEGNEYAEA